VSEASGSAYLAWNDALAARFFSPEVDGRPVRLFVTEEVVEEVGRSLGSGLEGFIEAIRDGPPGATRSGHCQRALQVAEGWRVKGFSYPPYLAYLGLFVLAGGHEGAFDPRSYYPRLWELLGENEVGPPPSFDQMWELWEDLEKWSVHDRKGQLGIFDARPVGGKIHIGHPLAQTVLTEAERRALPRIFADAGLDVGSLPSDRELRRALVPQGRRLLRRQTLKALEAGTASQAGALLDLVSNEFLDWDGAVLGEVVGADLRGYVSAALRLCLRLDRVSGRARASVRCRSKRQLPDDGLVLTSPAIAEPLTCGTFLPGWSHALVNSVTGTDFEPPPSAWRSGLVLSTIPARWTLRLRPAGVRLFVKGDTDQLPDLVEVRHLPRGTTFYLAFLETVWPILKSWIETDCEGWQRVDVTHGIPAGWIFGSILQAHTDRGLRKIDGELGFPDRRSLRLVGGVHAAAGNVFFDFAPPQVVLDGAAPGDTVTCNQQVLDGGAATPRTYDLPSKLPLDTRVGIEARNGEAVMTRRSLYLVTGSPWRLDEPLAGFDGFGQQVAAGDGIAGAAVPKTEAEPFACDLLRTPGLGSAAPRIYFVGRCPGQIASWPTEAIPIWEPVWAIPFWRRGRAVYCGNSLSSATPLPREPGGQVNAKIRHQVIWLWRARIMPPREPALRALWKQYTEAARDA